MGLEYLVIVFFFGLATAIIGKAKGSSFLIWFLVGAVLPLLGLVAVILFRSEKNEPERRCPNCHKTLKLYGRSARDAGPTSTSQIPPQFATQV